MVYRGTYRGEAVAIKMLLPDARKTLRQINSFLSEIKMMAALEHPRIVRLVGVAWDSLADLCAVSEYMEGGDLRSHLNFMEWHERRPHGFDLEKARIALHVAHSLTYGESRREDHGLWCLPGKQRLHDDSGRWNVLVDGPGGYDGRALRL